MKAECTGLTVLPSLRKQNPPIGEFLVWHRLERHQVLTYTLAAPASLGKRSQLVWINDQFDSSSFLVLNGDIRELGHALDINAVIFEIPCCQHQSLYSLVDGSRANRLHLRMHMVAEYTCNGTGDSRGA